MPWCGRHRRGRAPSRPDPPGRSPPYRRGSRCRGEPVHPDHIDQMPQVERLEHHRVVVEASQVVAQGVVGDLDPRLGADLPGVIGPPHRRGGSRHRGAGPDGASGTSSKSPEKMSRVAQTRVSNGFPMQLTRSSRPAAGSRGTHWGGSRWGARSTTASKKGGSVSKVAPVDSPADLEALEPDLGGPLRLGDGEGHVLQRDSRPQCDEAIGMLGHGGGDPVVLHPAQLRPDLARCPVAVLGDEGGQALDVHPIRSMCSSRTSGTVSASAMAGNIFLLCSAKPRP